MTLVEFERDVFAVAMSSPICDIPAVRSLTPTSITLRVHIAGDGFIPLSGSISFSDFVEQIEHQ